MANSKYFAGIFAAIISSASMPALAQSTATATSAAADETPTNPDDIIVTARRVNERLQDVPVAVTAIGAVALKDMSIKELKDMASLSPGLVIKTSSNDSNAALVALRGQWPSGILISLDSSVGVYVDGYNNPRTQGFRQALVDVSRVEVLRGPQGTLYGRNTTGGAISVITNSPTTDRLEGSLQLRAGNFDTFNVVGIVNVPLAEGLAARFVAQKGYSAGYARDSVGQNLGDEKSGYFRGKLRYESGDFSAEAYGDYSNFRNGGPVSRASGLTAFTTPVGGLSTQEVAAEMGLPANAAGWATALAALQPYVYTLNGPNTSSAYDNRGVGQFYTFESYSGGLDMKLGLSDDISLRSLTAYRNFKRLNQIDFDGTPYNILDIRFRGEDEFFSQELQLLGKLGPVSFVVGGFYSYENGIDSNASRSTAAIAAAAGRPAFDTQGGLIVNKSIAAYAQANWKITDQLTLTLGGRYTEDTRRATLIRHNNQAFITLPLPDGNTTGCLVPAAVLNSPTQCRGTLENKFSDPSWLASLDYKVTPDILFYGKIARGYRTGGQNIRATTLASIQPFFPETITEYELGMKADLFDRFMRLNVALFHDDYNNVQRVTAIVVGGVTSAPISNAATAKIDGVEIEATLHPAKGLTLNGNIAYVRARYSTFVDATGDRSNEAWPTPDWTYALSARYAIPVGEDELAFQADISGQSTQNLYPAVARQQIDVTQPAYSLVNGRISYTLKSNLEMAVFGRNLFDKVYADGGLANEGLGINLLQIAPPRTYGIEFLYKF